MLMTLRTVKPTHNISDNWLFQLNCLESGEEIIQEQLIRSKKFGKKFVAVQL